MCVAGVAALDCSSDEVRGAVAFYGEVWLQFFCGVGTVLVCSVVWLFDVFDMFCAMVLVVFYGGGGGASGGSRVFPVAWCFSNEPCLRGLWL